jgi:hypothetical protein
MKIAVLYIATGRYLQFFDTFYKSAERYFFKDIPKQYFVFTDNINCRSLCRDNITFVHQEHMEWPFITLFRYKMFLSIQSKLTPFDYVFFCNSNSLFIKHVGHEILPSANENHLVAVVRNPLVLSKDIDSFSYERNPVSSAYIPFGQGVYYFRGGFNGGKVKEYLDLCKTIDSNVEKDKKKNIIAIWHDESHLNKYLFNTPPKVLGPSYCFAQEWFGRIDGIKPIIMMRDKKLYFGNLSTRLSKKAKMYIKYTCHYLMMLYRFIKRMLHNRRIKFT